MRAAIYYTPAPGSDFARLGATWLGRDAFAERAGVPDAAPDRAELVAEPARYGFHATLRAPFRLRADRHLDELADRLGAFCAARRRPVIGGLVVDRLGPFFALVPAVAEPALADLEADALQTFESFRAPLSEEEVAARHPQRLNPRQLAHLHRWGYPFVLDEFRFHMTLSGAVPDAAVDLRRCLDTHFAAVLRKPLPLDGLGLFVEPEPGAPFRVHAFHPFGPATVPQPAATS